MRVCLCVCACVYEVRATYVYTNTRERVWIVIWRDILPIREIIPTFDNNIRKYIEGLHQPAWQPLQAVLGHVQSAQAPLGGGRGPPLLPCRRRHGHLLQPAARDVEVGQPSD